MYNTLQTCRRSAIGFVVIILEPPPPTKICIFHDNSKRATRRFIRGSSAFAYRRSRSRPSLPRRSDRHPSSFPYNNIIISVPTTDTRIILHYLYYFLTTEIQWTRPRCFAARRSFIILSRTSSRTSLVIYMLWSSSSVFFAYETCPVGA